MARRKARRVMVETKQDQGPKETVETPKVEKVEKAESAGGSKVAPPNKEAFSVLEKAKPVFTLERRVGAVGLPLNPDYCPPGIRVAWVTDPAANDIDAAENREKGYVFATPEMVTGDPEEAVSKGLIYFSWFQKDSHVDEKNRVRFRGLRLMVTRQEWWENRMKEMYRRVAAAVSQGSGWLDKAAQSGNVVSDMLVAKAESRDEQPLKEG